MSISMRPAILIVKFEDMNTEETVLAYDTYQFEPKLSELNHLL